MQQVDVITYAGQINVTGYERVCAALAAKQSPKALLVIATPGGDADAGFRIARALQHTYGAFEALIPRYCKSAGTLIAIGASRLYMDDRSELGPLDVQVKKGDELFGRSSGLDIFQALNYLQIQAMSGFRNYLVELTGSVGLSTRVASDIAARLTCGLLEPIAGQIDPMKLAEMQRATDIAFEYGHRLNEASQNLISSNSLAKLVSGYPSHGFVIDRKEARTVFTRVDKPDGVYGKLSASIHDEIDDDTNSRVPLVKLTTFELPEDDHDARPVQDAAPASAGAAPSLEAIDGAGSANGSGTSTNSPDGAAAP